jgi:predicted amidohydrolase
MSLQLVVCDSPAGMLGMTVCYDLRFPVVYQTLTWGMGAKVLLVPSAFTKVTGRQPFTAQCVDLSSLVTSCHHSKQAMCSQLFEQQCKLNRVR